MEIMKTDGGVELEYQVTAGEEPVVLIHGAFIADTFQPLVTGTKLAGRYQLIHYHRRGYAGSSRVSGIVGVAQHAADCRALLRHLGIDHAHVVGHSYGGAVALQLALDTPGVVHSLALLEPALMVGASAQAYRNSLARATQHCRESGPEIAVAEFLQARCPEYQAIFDRRLPAAFAQAVADAETAFEHELPGLLDWQFGEAEARRIGQPTLSVLGGGSISLSPRFGESHELLLAWQPHAEAFVLPDATHFLQVEDPLGIAEALAAFWGNNRLPNDAS